MDDHVAAVGDADGLGEVLLGHQHGEVVALLQLVILSMVRLTSSGARPTEGSSTSRIAAPTSGRGQAPASAARRRSCCRRAGGGARSAAGRSRSRSRDCGQRRPRRRAERAEQKVLLDRQPGKQAASFGHQGDAEVDDLLGREADKIVPMPSIVAMMLPALGRTMPMTHFIRVDFAVAVGAEQCHGLAAADCRATRPRARARRRSRHACRLW